MFSPPHNYTGNCPLRLHSATSPPGGWTCQHGTGICLLLCRFGEPPLLTAPSRALTANTYPDPPGRDGWGQKRLGLWVCSILVARHFTSSASTHPIFPARKIALPARPITLLTRPITLPVGPIIVPATLHSSPMVLTSSSTVLCQLKKQVILFCVGSWGSGLSCPLARCTLGCFGKSQPFWVAYFRVHLFKMMSQFLYWLDAIMDRSGTFS